MNNNSNEENRVCRKCGKRLPSNNNFCMFCGCNNNISEEEENALKNAPIDPKNMDIKHLFRKNDNNSNSINTNLITNTNMSSNTSNISNTNNIFNTNTNTSTSDDNSNNTSEVIVKEKNSLRTNLIYLFVLIDIIFISSIFIFKSNGLLIEKFKYNFNKDDEIYYYNGGFLKRDNDKIKLYDDSIISNKVLDQINSEKVVDMGMTTDRLLLVETNKYIYSFDGEYGSTHADKEIFKNASKNVFKDYNLANYYYNKDDDYYNSISDGYFIKDGELYKNEEIESRNLDYNSKYLYNYRSIKVISKDKLDIVNPKLIYTDDDLTIIKGDNIIKIFNKDILIQSINSFTKDNKVYKLSDFKYVFNDGKSFLFVCNNGKKIDYSIDTFSISRFDDTTDKSDLNKNINLDKQDNNILYGTSSTKTSTFKNLLKGDNLKVIIILIAYIIVLMGAIYKFKEAKFSLSVIICTIINTLAIYILLLTSTELDIKIFWEITKAMISVIPIMCLVGIVLTQIRDIVNYVSEKFNIETIYHFIFMYVSILVLFAATFTLSNDLLVIVITPCIVWAFLTFNNENDIKYDFDNKSLLILGSTLLISLLLGLILCSVLKICNFYLLLLIMAFSVACYIILNNENNIKETIITSFKSFLVLIITIILYILSGIVNLLKIDSSLGEEYAKMARETIFKMNFELGFFILLFVIVLCVLFGLLIYILKLPKDKITSMFDNRQLKIFIYMIILVIIFAFVIYFLPYIVRFVIKMIGKTFEIDDIFNVFYSL